MKTIVYPVLDFNRVARLDRGYVTQYWAEVLFQVGSWNLALNHFLQRYRTGTGGVSHWFPWVVSVAVMERDDIERLSTRLNSEINVEPLPGLVLGACAARSAATA